MSETEAVSLKMPFGPADVFGYLIPGATFLICILAFESWANGTANITQHVFHVPSYRALADAKTFAGVENTVMAAAFVLVLTVAAYVAGHVVSSISSLCIDRCLIYK